AGRSCRAGRRGEGPSAGPPPTLPCAPARGIVRSRVARPSPLWSPPVNNPIRRSAAPITEPLLDAVEAHLGVPLPPEYRALLLAHNGGVPARNTFTYTNNKGRKKTARLTWLYPVGRDRLVDAAATDLVSAHALRPVGLPPGLLPIGDVTTDMALGVLCI